VPSRVTGSDKKAARGQWPIGQWKRELSAEQVQTGLKILAHFGLDRLYGDEAMPRREFLPGHRLDHRDSIRTPVPAPAASMGRDMRGSTNRLPMVSPLQ